MRWTAVQFSLLLILAMVSCTSTTTTSTKQSPQNPGFPTRPLDLIDNAGGVTQSTTVRAALLPLGSVSYDNLVLPLVSPDGRFIATQTGAPPTWDTMLGKPSASVPVATQIEVYELDRRAESGERQPPVLTTILGDSAVLGRSVDAQGFLVEAQREDGSRWIGKASWNTGTISWLQANSSVNAFGVLSHDGKLAWSRRSVEDSNFGLAAQTHNDEWTIESEGEDWLFPVWSNRGDALFVLHLKDGVLEARYGNASSRAAFLQSMQRFQLATNATLFTAYQTLSGQLGIAIDPATPHDQLVYFHPALGRSALWRPLSTGTRRAMHLNSGSIAAYVDRPDFAFVTTNKELIRQSLASSSAKAPLVAGTQIIRPTPQSDWPYLLLSPEEGFIGVMAMRLMAR